MPKKFLTYQSRSVDWESYLSSIPLQCTKPSDDDREISLTRVSLPAAVTDGSICSESISVFIKNGVGQCKI